MSSPQTRCGASALGLWCVLAIGCADERIVVRPIDVRLPAATSCRPIAPLASLRLRALGDGPASETSVLETRRDEPIRTLPQLAFPLLAVHAAAEATGWRGIGWRPIDASGSEITLLPLGLSCPLADPEVRAPIGASVAVMLDGTLMIAGGLDDEGVASERVVLLAPGAQLAELAPSGLALPSAHATVTGLPGGRALIAGGTIAESAPPYERFEIFDPRAGAARTIEPLRAPRRDHSAILLRDGRVLLVGGRDAIAGSPLATLELIDPETRESRASASSLAIPRVRPALAIAEGGAVWIAGGEEAGTGLAIERFDPASDTVESFDGLDALPPPIALAWLPGDRLAWMSESAAHVVLVRDDRAIVIAPSPGALVPSLDEARASATLGGRVSVLGQRDGSRSGHLFDPGLGRFEARAGSRVPTELVTMVDGSVIELSGSGASLRREDEPTPYDDPPATLLFGNDDAQWLRDPTGDRWAAPRWSIEGSELVAIEGGARVDLRALRGTRWALALRSAGAIDVLLIPEGAPPVVIALGDGVAGIDGCVLEHTDGDALEVSIEPGRAVLTSEARTRECELPALGRIGLAFRARAPGAILSRLDIARR